MGGLFATSIYGMEQRKPFVNLRHQDWVVQITPVEAREWALNILECAEASEQDAFLVEFLSDNLNLELEVAVRVLHEYRGWRERKGEGGDG